MREAVENGIKSCRRGIIIISKNFLSNNGWTKSEFNALFQKEIIEKKHVIIPIWIDVTHQDVYEYSPILADRKALFMSEGLDVVVNSLVELAQGGRLDKKNAPAESDDSDISG